LEALKSSQIDCLMTAPSGVIMTTPIPAPFALETPSTYNLHQLVSSINSWSQVGMFGIFYLNTGVNSAIKSANTCPLIVALGRYFTSKVPIFAPHFEIRPVKIGPFEHSLDGVLCYHVNGMSLEVLGNFLAAVTNVRLIFSSGR
jgi:hypothetical protein